MITLLPSLSLLLATIPQLITAKLILHITNLGHIIPKIWRVWIIGRQTIITYIQCRITKHSALPTQTLNMLVADLAILKSRDTVINLFCASSPGHSPTVLVPVAAKAIHDAIPIVIN